MQTGQIVRILDIGDKVQILCADQWGLLSVYCERKPFNLLFRVVKRAGLELQGLLINFNRDAIRVPALGDNRDYSTH